MKKLSAFSDYDSWVLDTDWPELHIWVHDVIRTHDVTALRLVASSCKDEGEFLKEYTGSAKRSPVDSNDPELGVLIAFRNALGQLYAEVDKQVEGRIIHQDDMLEEKLVRELEDECEDECNYLTQLFGWDSLDEFFRIVGNADSPDMKALRDDLSPWNYPRPASEA